MPKFLFLEYLMRYANCLKIPKMLIFNLNIFPLEILLKTLESSYFSGVYEGNTKIT